MLSSVLATVALGQTLTGPRLQVTMSNGKSFVIQTAERESPRTVKRIVALVEQGFYNGIRFHRVEPWVVQWGDPKSKQSVDAPGVGGGGSGQGLPFEESKIPFTEGTVGVASTGMKVGGDSQLFVLTRAATHLNGNYAVLGRVVSGMDVVKAIERGDTISKIVVLKAAK